MVLGSIAVLSLLTAVGIGLERGFGLWLLLGSFLGSFLCYALIFCLFIIAVCGCVDLNKPREEDSKFFRTLMYPCVDTLITLSRLRLIAAGLEKIPARGRFLVVCNHQNESDCGILHHYFKKHQLAFVSKKENVDMFLINKIMHMTLCQLLDRENDRAALTTIRSCVRLLQEDKVSICAFPEGGIKEEHKLNPFRPGVFKIAQKAKVPIVVCTLQGTEEFFRRLKKWKPIPVQFHVLEVIPAEALEGRTTIEISRQVFDLMQADLGSSWALEETE